jgi:hypothetical protein
MKPSTDLSFMPRFSTVSIMPGMEMAAPERTDTSSGSLASPSFLPISFSSLASFSSTWSHMPGGYLLLFLL